jgi:hypothetical protein
MNGWATGLIHSNHKRGHPWIQERYVALEFVDDDAFDQLPFFIRHQRHRPVK